MRCPAGTPKDRRKLASDDEARQTLGTGGHLLCRRRVADRPLSPCPARHRIAACHRVDPRRCLPADDARLPGTEAPVQPDDARLTWYGQDEPRDDGQRRSRLMRTGPAAALRPAPRETEARKSSMMRCCFDNRVCIGLGLVATGPPVIHPPAG